MRWIDEAANACGTDWAGVRGLTSYVAAIRFCMPLVVGDQIEVTARLIHTGPRSIHIGVHVTITDMVGGPTCVAAEGSVVIVSLDESGNARAVAQWRPGCGEDQRLDRLAQRLVELRPFFEPCSSSTASAAITR